MNTQQSFERISKQDGAVSPASEEQVRRGLRNAVHNVDLALEHIRAGQEIGNNFFTYRLLSDPSPK